MAPVAPPETMVVFTRPGDRFEPGALALVSAAAANREVGLVYWDDALIDEQGRLGSPRFRPDWSPELLLAAPYLHRAFAIRRDRLGPPATPIARSVGTGTPIGGAGADRTSVLWEMVLECRFGEDEVVHIPRILAGVTDRDDRADPAVANAHLHRTGLPAAMGDSGAISWAPAAWPRVTIVIPTRHHREHLTALFPALAATSYPEFEIVVVDNGSRSPANEAWYETQASGLSLTVDWWDQAFNYSAVNNHGAALGGGTVLVFLNDDAVPLHPTWLENLVGWLELPAVGVVGAFLLDSQGNLDHAGIVIGLHSLAGHLLRTCRPDELTMFGPADWPRNVMAVTGACTAVRRSTFDEIGGFDERFVLTGSDVALGVAAIERGYRNVCTPWSRLRHDERSTRGRSDPEQDTRLAVEILSDWLAAGDPWYSPNLSLRSPRPELRSRAEIAPDHR